MRIAGSITKATITHSQDVTLIVFPQQQWLHKRASMLRYTYVACLVGFSCAVKIYGVPTNRYSCVKSWSHDNQSLPTIVPELKYVYVLWICLLHPGLDPRRKRLHWTLFGDESTCQVLGHVNGHIVQTWGTVLRKKHVTHEHIRDNPKLNASCGLLHDKVLSPYFFYGKTFT